MPDQVQVADKERLQFSGLPLRECYIAARVLLKLSFEFIDKALLVATARFLGRTLLSKGHQSMG